MRKWLISSIGLGGGSLVRIDGSEVTVGPDSVGYRITSEALVFGGRVLTATDIAVAGGQQGVGDADLVKLSPEMVAAAQRRMRVMLETTLDSMKTSPVDIPVYLVGGGGILAPDILSGVSKVHRFPHYQCANAVGAAIAQVAGIVDSVENIEGQSMAQAQKRVEQRAIEQAVSNGASRSTVVIVESEAIPIAYTAGKCRFSVKAAGEWVNTSGHSASDYPTVKMFSPGKTTAPKAARTADEHWTVQAIENYRPKITANEWVLSEIDLEWLCVGTYILGCGGGGDPEHTFLAARELLRRGQTIRVRDLGSLQSCDLVGWGGGMGSPEVASERLMSDEWVTAVTSADIDIWRPPKRFTIS